MVAHRKWSLYAFSCAAVFLAFSAGRVLTGPGKTPVAEVSPNEIQLGMVAVGRSGQGSFTLSNRGAAPLIVRGLKSSCECSTASLLRRELGPGESENVTIVFRPASPGVRRNQILIETNDPRCPSLIVTLVGTGIS